VGAIGFPTSGIMGTAIEIALGPADAFGFIVTEILDKIDAARPFFGYVSIRITSPTKTLMGMQQFGDSANPHSVMIEIVAFASPNSQLFMRDLQIRTLDRISKGLDAMLHWGLENDRVNGGHLRATMALRRPTSAGVSKLDTFKALRGILRAASLAQPNVFDNAFTSRLWLNSQVADDDPYSFQAVLQGTRKSTVIAPWNRGNSPMRIIGVYADGAFRLRGSFDTPSRPPNLEIGTIPAAPTHVGDFFELPVTFIAVEPGQHNGTLTIVTHADVPDSIRIIRVHLNASVDALVVSVVDPAPPSGRDFGTVTVGDTKTMQILVYSDSTMSAQLDSYALPDALATSQIGVATFGVGPLVPGQTKAYWVSCTPTVVGPSATNLILTFVAGVFTRYTQELTVPIFWNAVGAQAELAPSTLDFGTVVVGARSAAAPVTLRNRGQLPLTVSYTLIGAGFQVAGQAPTSIAAGQDEEIFIEFRPVANGPVSYPFTIASNSAQPPAPVLLTGIGLLQPFFTASPGSVSFGSVPIGSQSPQRVVEIVNAGQIVVTLQAFTLSGPDAADFKITNVDRAVGDVFRLEQPLRVTLVFAARTAGMKAATLEIAHNGTTSPFRVSIDGIATAVQGLVPSVTELDLGNVRINTHSKQRTMTFTNAAAVAAHVTMVDVTGRDRADFLVISENCTANPLAPGGGTCTVTLIAQPSAMGPREADLTLTADVPADNVPLHAVGLDIRVEWSAAILEFDKWKVGQTSQRQEVTLHNSGNAPVNVTGIDVDGDFLVQDIVPQYMSIPPNGYKYFWAWFRPTAAGPQQGSLTVQTNDPVALPALELTGTGVP
ncbi:MAG: choice-of-anchor D domain-containing protein, partial [Acidobacteriota bacterium]